MSVNRENGFAGFARENYSDLVRHLGAAIGASLHVEDHEGAAIIGSNGSAEGEDRAARKGGTLSAPIEGLEGDLGRIVARSDDARLEPLLGSLARNLGDRFGVENEIRQMTDDLSYAYDQIGLLCRFTRVLRPDESFSANAQRLVEEMGDLLSQRQLILCLPKRNLVITTADYRPGFARSLRWVSEDRTSLLRIHAESALAMRGKTPGDRSRHTGVVETPDEPLRYVLVPIWIRSEYVGYVGLFGRPGDHYIETNELLLLESLAEEMSNTATSIEIREELRTLLFSVVRSLVVAIEAKDKYTKGHSERIFHISARIAEILELPSEEILDVTWAALLHDVGKISVDEKILNKPGRLTEEEFDEIKKHPVIGCRMIEPITQLHGILDGIRHHHEHYDGSGYPDGLKGNEIPLIGRIIAVADTYDAIVSDRPYRPGGSHEKAVGVITEMSGIQFCPDVVAAFMKANEAGLLDDLRPEPAAAAATAE